LSKEAIIHQNLIKVVHTEDLFKRHLDSVEGEINTEEEVPHSEEGEDLGEWRGLKEDNLREIGLRRILMEGLIRLF
jgi:hypothetical protein